MHPNGQATKIMLPSAPAPKRDLGQVVHDATARIREVPVLRSRTADAFADIIALGHATRFRKGQTIVCEDDSAVRCFQVVRGVVRAYKLLADGRRQIIDFIYPGEFFGVSPGGVYGYSVDAVTDVTLHAYANSMLERIAQEKADVARLLREAAYRELRAAQAHIVLLGRRTATEKVASFLLSLIHRSTEENTDGKVVWVPMSQSDIADYLGLTTETVNRVVALLREAGVISTPSRGIIRLERVTELEDTACAA